MSYGDIFADLEMFYDAGDVRREEGVGGDCDEEKQKEQPYYATAENQSPVATVLASDQRRVRYWNIQGSAMKI